jgi:hypothetical protein
MSDDKGGTPGHQAQQGLLNVQFCTTSHDYFSEIALRHT